MITGMHPREDWQSPSQPVRGPAPKGTPRTWVIHYPGGGGAPVGSAVAPYLRNIQADYTSNRGYSIGYSFGVSQDGQSWEIRGDDFNNAANKGSKWNDQGNSGNFNDVSQSIFVMVAGQDEATNVAVVSINRIIASHPDWAVIIHGDVDYTSCCGTGLIAQVRNGTIGQHDQPQPPTGDDEKMLWIGKKSGTSSHHTADGVQRTYTASPQILIDSAVASGRPLKDMGSGRDVTQLSHVSSVSGAVIDAHGFDVG